MINIIRHVLRILTMPTMIALCQDGRNVVMHDQDHAMIIIYVTTISISIMLFLITHAG